MFNDVQCRLYGCDYGSVMAQLPLGFFLGDLVSVRLCICCFHVVGLEPFVVCAWKLRSPQLRMYRFTLDYTCDHLNNRGTVADGSKRWGAMAMERKQVWPGRKDEE